MIYTNTNDLLIYIRQQMLARKISIKELSNRMNKSQSATGQMFRQNNITLESLNDICSSLDYQLEINLISDKISNYDEKISLVEELNTKVTSEETIRNNNEIKRNETIRNIVEELEITQSDINDILNMIGGL